MIAPDELVTALTAAKHLVDHGVPVVLAEPILDAQGNWDPTAGCSGYRLPRGWQHAEADPGVLARWRPGMGVMAVMGHAVDGLDVDPRNGGDESVTQLAAAGGLPRSYGRAVTPSGGTHDLIAALGVASRDGALPGVDVKAGEPDGSGRGFLWIAPTVKLSKETGELVAYRWETAPDLDELDDLDDTGDVLRARIAAARTPAPTVAEDAPQTAWDALDGPTQARVRRWLAGAVDGLRDDLAAAQGWPEGHRDADGRGWEKITADAANRLGRLARAPWTPWTMHDALEALRSVVPASIAASVDVDGKWRDQHARRSPATPPEGLLEPVTVGSLHTLADAPGAPWQADPAEQGDPAPRRRLDVVRAAEIVARRVVYLWDRRVPLGAVTLMPGEEGIGKSTVTCRILADVTRGTLPGEFFGTPRNVTIMAPEDGIEDVLTPRLREAGADMERVFIIRGRLATGEDDDGGDLILPRDLDLLSEHVREVDSAVLCIDSFVTSLPAEAKAISYKDMASVLRSIGTWASTERVAVVAPWHLNKGSGSDTAARMMDSRAFRTAVRSVLLVVPDPDAPEGTTQGIVALDKANAGTLAVPALRYAIRSASYVVEEVDPITGEVVTVPASCGVADWIGEVEGDGREVARDALAPRVSREDDPRAWLRHHLTERGEVARSDVMAAARDEGFSEDQIKRAARAMRLVSRHHGGQDHGRPTRAAYWSLPQSGAIRAAAPLSSPPAPTAPSGESDRPPTTPIPAGQRQSVQSVQSGESRENRPTERPTGDQPRPTGGRPAGEPAPLVAAHLRCPACNALIGHESTCPNAQETR